MLVLWMICLTSQNIFAQKVNIALNKPANQSSTFTYKEYSFWASYANDGKLDQIIQLSEWGGPAVMCSHTEVNEPEYWWAVDLGQEIQIDSITIYNRIDRSCVTDCAKRLANFDINVYNPRGQVGESFRQGEAQCCYHHAGFSPSILHLACYNMVRGRVIEISKPLQSGITSEDALTLCEVKVFTNEHTDDRTILETISPQNLPLVESRIHCSLQCSRMSQCLGFYINSNQECLMYQTSSVDLSGATQGIYERC